MDESDLAIFRKFTGRNTPRPGGYAETLAITGRQSGKTQIAALVGVFEAAMAVMSGQRGVYVPLIAQDLRGAQRALLGYVREAGLYSPVIANAVEREDATTIELTGP